MKRILLIVISIILISCTINNPFTDDTEMSVLFLGNSFTGYNNMPGMFSFLSDKAGKGTYVDYVIKYGASMREVIGDSIVYKKFRERKWDAIVIQSDYDIAYTYKRSQIIQSLLAFRDSVSDMNEDADIYLASVWAPVDGYITDANDTLTYEEFQDMLTEGTDYTANALEFHIVPAGYVWSALRNETIDYKYDDDGYHPGIAGSYIYACAAYCAVYCSAVSGIGYYAGVEEREAVLIQGCSDSIIIKNIGRWNL